MAEKKKETNKGIQVTFENGILRIEDGDRFVEGNGVLSFGMKRRIQNLSAPKKMTVKGEDDPITMYLDDDYDPRKDTDLFILDKTLTKWSSDKPLKWQNILDEVELADLLEEYVKEFKKINRLVKSKEDEEEKN